MRRLLLLLFSVLIPLRPSAQDTASIPDSLFLEEPIELPEEMVITVTRSVRRKSELPATVNVISRLQIENSAARNVDDLLSTVSGVQVRRSVGMGEGIPSDIMLRGIPAALAAARVLVLVDGIPTNAVGTPFLILNEVPLDAIERVEVVNGPYSALYGANAYGGVINVITRTPEEGSFLEAKAGTSGPFSAIHSYSRGLRGSAMLEKSAEEAFYQGSVVGGAKNEAFSLLASAGIRRIGNYLLRDSAFVRNGEITYHKGAQNHDYHDMRLFLKGGFRPHEKVNVALHFRTFSSELGFGLTQSTSQPHDVITKGHKILVGPYIDAKLSDDLTLKAGTFYRTVSGSFNNQSLTLNGEMVPSVWDSRAADWSSEAVVIYNAAEFGILTAGFDHLRNRIDFGATRNSLTNEPLAGSVQVSEVLSYTGLYFQNDLKLPWKLGAVGGVRIDLPSHADVSLSPRVGLTWRGIKSLSLRLSSGQAFRAPAASELYMPDLALNESIKLRSNPELEAERITAVEGGFDFKFGREATLRSTFYHNRMEDLITPDIQDVDAQSGSALITHENMSGARSAGVENVIEYRPLDWFRGEVSYTWQKSEEIERKRPLDYVPEHTASFRLGVFRTVGSYNVDATFTQLWTGRREFRDWANSELSFLGTNQYLYTPMRELDPYWRTDLSLKCTYNDRFWMALNAQNLFDAQIEESPGTLAPGRFIALELGYKVF
ncbi:MAG: TonB-dependent receptor plug domain-containing protein [Fibrobacterota bacterium]